MHYLFFFLTTVLKKSKNKNNQKPQNKKQNKKTPKTPKNQNQTKNKNLLLKCKDKVLGTALDLNVCEGSLVEDLCSEKRAV